MTMLNFDLKDAPGLKLGRIWYAYIPCKHDKNIIHSSNQTLQTNSWFGRYRHNMRYMNASRFNFYMVFVCHLNNMARQQRTNTVSRLPNRTGPLGFTVIYLIRTKTKKFQRDLI